jgi:hypothetical protein
MLSCEKNQSMGGDTEADVQREGGKGDNWQGVRLWL